MDLSPQSLWKNVDFKFLKEKDVEIIISPSHSPALRISFSFVF